MSTLATDAQAVSEWARNVGRDNPDREWLLSDRDSWERNPFYTGKPGAHPEADEDPQPARNMTYPEWFAQARHVDNLEAELHYAVNDDAGPGVIFPCGGYIDGDATIGYTLTISNDSWQGALEELAPRLYVWMLDEDCLTVEEGK